uniref:Uncharacterized protein n=1 Tax=Lepeophtheirus salmonis TaxID=72036 RepID=A0A0K2T1Z0_LEPSM
MKAWCTKLSLWQLREKLQWMKDAAYIFLQDTLNSKIKMVFLLVGGESHGDRPGVSHIAAE